MRKVVSISLFVLINSFMSSAHARPSSLALAARGVAYTVGGGVAGAVIGFSASAAACSIAASKSSDKSAGAATTYVSLIAAFYGMIAGAVLGAAKAITPYTEVRKSREVFNPPSITYKENHATDTQSLSAR